MGKGGLGSIIKSLQSAEKYLSPALAFARKDIENKTGLPLTARDAPKAAAMAAAQKKEAAPEEQADYKNKAAIGGGGAAGAHSMVTVRPEIAPTMLGNKTMLGM